MKYTVETTENGCKETLEFEDGTKLIAETERTCFGCEGTTPSLASQAEEQGFSDEIVEKIDELCSGINAYDFLELAELES